MTWELSRIYAVNVSVRVPTPRRDENGLALLATSEWSGQMNASEKHRDMRHAVSMPYAIMIGF